MRTTKIVTSFITSNEKFLIVKRSEKVKTMKGLWSGISGIIEKNEEPLVRAKIEIFEEVGIIEKELKLLKTSKQINVNSPQYENHQWEIFPFLFYAENPSIKLNWENSEFQWIKPKDLKKFETVPNLDKVLLHLL